jgi:uncharacterized protein YjiS (DUF1127 family)
MAHASNIPAYAASPFTGLGDLVAGMRTRYARHRAYRDTLNELMALSDRELADLDLHRATLKDIAFDAAYGEGSAH